MFFSLIAEDSTWLMFISVEYYFKLALNIFEDFLQPGKSKVKFGGGEGPRDRWLIFQMGHRSTGKIFPPVLELFTL